MSCSALAALVAARPCRRQAAAPGPAVNFANMIRRRRSVPAVPYMPIAASRPTSTPTIVASPVNGTGRHHAARLFGSGVTLREQLS